MTWLMRITIAITVSSSDRHSQAVLEEASARKLEEQRLLAERLQESVVPLFIDRGGQPDRSGSWVLLHLDSAFFTFTAPHGIREANSAHSYAPARWTATN